MGIVDVEVEAVIGTGAAAAAADADADLSRGPFDMGFQFDYSVNYKKRAR